MRGGYFVGRPGATAAQGTSRDTPEDRPWGSSPHIPVRRRSREMPCASIAPGLLSQWFGGRRSRPVSRVLSRAVIPLRCASPRTC